MDILPSESEAADPTASNHKYLSIGWNCDGRSSAKAQGFPRYQHQQFFPWQAPSIGWRPASMTLKIWFRIFEYELKLSA